MSATVRMLVGLGAIGGVSGATYLLHQQLSTENIEKKLKVNGYEILSDDKLSDWQQILTNYKARIEAQKTDLQFDDFDGKTPSENAEKKLQEKCKDALKLSSGNEIYKKAEKWCTVPKKLSKVLESKGHRVLSTSSTDDNTDQQNWNEIINEHNKDKENVGKRFEGVATKHQGKLKNDEESRKEIKGKCQELLDKFHYDKDFETILERAELWCVAKKTK